MSAPVPTLPKFAADCREMLATFDAGRSIWSVERGGLGPGYEQTIQLMAVEFTRTALDLPLEGESDDAKWLVFREACDRALKPINASLGGVSGAQFGCAVQIAYAWLHAQGPVDFYDKVKAAGGHPIQVSNRWPRIEREAA